MYDNDPPHPPQQPLCSTLLNHCALSHPRHPAHKHARPPARPFIVRSNLDPTRPEPCRPLVLLFNGLCLLAALMAKLSMSVAGAAGGAVAVTLATWASAVAAGLAWLAAGVVMLAVSAWCPEPSRPLGGPQVHTWVLRQTNQPVAHTICSLIRYML